MEQRLANIEAIQMKLSESVIKLSTTLDSFIKYSEDVKVKRFEGMEKKIDDLEIRVRQNTKFMYQAIAGITVLLFTVEQLFKFITK